MLFSFLNSKKVQIKVKKQHDDELLDDGETQVYLTNEDGDSMQAGNEMYVIEQVGGGDMTESEGDDYVEFELDGNKSDDRIGGNGSGGGGSMESIDENSLLTAPEFEYVSHRSKPTVKRMRESTGTPHEFTTSTAYRRVCGSGGITSNYTSHERSLIELQKKLLQDEFDHKKKLRDEKHQLECAILKADLTNKTLEHQKQMELLDKKLQDKTHM